MSESLIELAVPSAYKTSTMAGFFNKSIELAKELEIFYSLNKNEKDIFRVCGYPEHPNVDECIGLVGNIEKIDTFFHPIIHKDKAYIDCRAFLNKETKITEVFEYTFKYHRGLLDLRWIKDKEIFNTVLDMSIDIFSSWVSWGLERATNAHLNVITNYRLLAAIYYLGFFSTHQYDDNEIGDYIIKKISRICVVPVRVVDELITIDPDSIYDLFKVGTKNHIVDKLSFLSKALTDVTNEDIIINPNLIKNALCRGAFIAGNPIEITAISLEHPPTFIAILSRIIGKSYQSQTSIGRTANNLVRKHDIRSFEKFLLLNANVGT